METNETKNQLENSTENSEPAPTRAESKRLDFAKRFKPCRLVMFYAHGHRINDYKVTERESERQDDGTEVSRWRTTKTILDPENSRKALGLRAKFLSEVCKLGVQYGSEKLVFVDFERSDDLDALKARWREAIREFNAQSPIVKLDLGILPPLDLTGSNEYLLESLLEELRDTMGQMKSALEQADYQGVRDVVKRLKGFVSLVPDKQASLIVDAIADAKKQARSMRAMLEVKGEEIAKVQETISTATVDIAVAACLGDDYIVEDGPSAADLMEAQAQEFCAALQEGSPVVDPESEVTPETDAPVVDPEPDQPAEASGYTPGDPLVTYPELSGPYWV